MAGSVNKVILVGNLGRDPETRQTQDGRPIVNMSVATSENWKDRQTGERRERTEWHRVVIFDERVAEVAQNYLRKGSKVYLEGQLQTRKWTDQSGQEKYTTEVVLQRFRGVLTMLDSRADSGGGSRDYGGEPAAAAVFNPATGEFWDAVKGDGCRLNGATVRVTDRASCAGARLLMRRRAIQRSRDPDLFRDAETADPRSIAYRLALVAAGRFDAVVSFGGKSDWDLAAAELLVTEAGGRVTTTAGMRFRYNRESTRHQSCIAANPVLHAALCEAFAGRR